MVALVIDASIARAAGEFTSRSDFSRSLHHLLNAIHAGPFYVVFDSELKAEWSRHQSNFARTWRTKMFSSKRLRILDVDANAELRTSCKAIALSDGQFLSLWKDFHLVELALATDKRVLSTDRRISEILHPLASDIKLMRRICWVNPTTPDSAVLDWLTTKAPFDKHRMLGCIENR